MIVNLFYFGVLGNFSRICSIAITVVIFATLANVQLHVHTSIVFVFSERTYLQTRYNLYFKTVTWSRAESNLNRKLS